MTLQVTVSDICLCLLLQPGLNKTALCLCAECDHHLMVTKSYAHADIITQDEYDDDHTIIMIWSSLYSSVIGGMKLTLIILTIQVRCCQRTCSCDIKSAGSNLSGVTCTLNSNSQPCFSRVVFALVCCQKQLVCVAASQFLSLIAHIATQQVAE